MKRSTTKGVWILRYKKTELKIKITKAILN